MQRVEKCASTDGCEPIDREQQRRMAGLLLSALRVPRVYQLLIDICCRRPRSAANAGGGQRHVESRGTGGSVQSHIGQFPR